MKNSVFFQQVVNEILCCPFCKCDIHLVDEHNLECTSCQTKYTMREGIFILMKVNALTEQFKEQRIREDVARQQENLDPEQILEVISQHHCIPVMSKRAESFRSKFDTSHWIMDMGCGTGYYWRNAGGGKLILIDFAFANLKIAKTLLEEQNNIVFIQADAANLPIKRDSISGIWSVQATQHFSDSVMGLFLDEIGSILKDKFFVEIYNLNPSLLYRVLYRVKGKRLHVKGKYGKFILNLFNADKLIFLWRRVVKNAMFKIGYSELFFHPDLFLKPKRRYVVFIEEVLAKIPLLAHLFARQIHINISTSSKKSGDMNKTKNKYLKPYDLNFIERSYLDCLHSILIHQCKKSEKILDFGSGKGRMKKRFKSYDITNYEIIPGYSDIESYVDKRFDTIVTCHALEHIERDELQQILSNFKKMGVKKLLVALPMNSPLSKTYFKIFGKNYYEDHFLDFFAIKEMIINREFKLTKEFNFLGLTIFYVFTNS